jgi:hypothetical protein
MQRSNQDRIVESAITTLMHYTEKSKLNHGCLTTLCEHILYLERNIESMKGDPLTKNDELFARARLEEIGIAVAMGVFTKETIEPELSALIRVCRTLPAIK